MNDLREALTKAWDAAFHTAIGELPKDESLPVAFGVAFLRSLEESGWKLVGPEVAPRMHLAGNTLLYVKHDYGGSADIFAAMIAHAPTIAELLEEKKG